eukprot:TRINITY_DN32328_c0_g1_i1.p1 TRINITY_DN32328_c0_g1~~TRINITY_DN32328_c0_g1_i1.p1  ORF type:complete len:342 (+),score=144.73 TRINITY_DN32328_c0_g1_i1:43-1068(+)
MKRRAPDGGGPPKRHKGGASKKIVRKSLDATEAEIAPPVDNVSGDLKSKQQRERYYAKYKLDRAVRKLARRERRKKEREEHGEDALPKEQPRTIDNMREADDTFVAGSDEEVVADELDDEYAEFYHDGVETKILLTTCTDPCLRTRGFINELLTLIPHSEYFERRGYEIKKITQYAVNRGYTDIMIVGDSGGGCKKKPYSMIITHLPQGPTHWYRISSVVFHKEIEDAAPRTEHYPELILKGFTTRLGRRVARQFRAMYPLSKDDKGRAVTTYHNHRDFIFVRSHRYCYDGTDAVRLQELGPRFTLRLRSLQAGLFNPQFGEYEWFRKKKEMDKSKKKFHL